MHKMGEADWQVIPAVQAGGWGGGDQQQALWAGRGDAQAQGSEPSLCLKRVTGLGVAPGGLLRFGSWAEVVKHEIWLPNTVYNISKKITNILNQIFLKFYCGHILKPIILKCIFISNVLSLKIISGKQAMWSNKLFKNKCSIVTNVNFKRVPQNTKVPIGVKHQEWICVLLHENEAWDMLVKTPTMSIWSGGSKNRKEIPLTCFYTADPVVYFWNLIGLFPGV